MRSTIKPRHVFGALVLIAQAPILAAFVAGWLISGLIYAIALGVEPARGHGRDWRHRPRFTRPETSPQRHVGGVRARGAGQRIALNKLTRR